MVLLPEFCSELVTNKKAVIPVCWWGLVLYGRRVDSLVTGLCSWVVVLLEYVGCCI